jgi:eukaryotic-like serine/threonine-protein kinase
MHKNNVIHRDLKPENILMDGNTAKIADLGLSKKLEIELNNRHT